jgi:hypothetical protein
MSSTGTTMPTDRIDPNVKVPAAVRRGAAASDAIHKQAYTPEGAPPVDLLVSPAPAAPTAPAATVPPAETPPDESTWEGRYKSIKGRYDKAQTTMSQQQGDISNLQNEVANLQRLLASVPPAPVTAPELAAGLTTPEERAQYGEEFMDVVARRAQEAVAPKLKTLEDENADLRRQLGGVTNVVVGNAREAMLTKLDADLPDWRAQNQDAQFLAWLRLPDMYSGANRGALLKSAFEQNQTDRVLAFFKGFLTEEATVAPAGTTTAPAPVVGERPSLESLAAPGRAKSAAAPPGGSPEKPIITRAQIAQFYVDVRAGRYKGQEAKKAADEAMIFDAERDGRIR